MAKYRVKHHLQHNGKLIEPGDRVELSEPEALRLSSCLEGVEEMKAERAETDAKRQKS